MLLSTPIPTCPPGSTTTYRESPDQVNSTINAIRTSEAQVAARSFVVSGKNMSFTAFDAAFETDAATAKYGVGDNNVVVLSCAPSDS